MALGPRQIGAIGDTAFKGIGSVIGRIGNARALKQKAEDLGKQRDYANEQFGRMGGQYQESMSPYVQSGQRALSDLQSYDTNIASRDPMQSRDAYGFKMDDFKTDPSYNFRLSQGVKALDQGAAGDGSLYSGGQQKELLKYGQNLGSEEYGNIYDRKFNEFRDANEQFRDTRDYNTRLSTEGMNRDLNRLNALNTQGYGANTATANTMLGLDQDKLATNLGYQSGIQGAESGRVQNRFGAMRDQNAIAGEGFNKFFGGR